MHDNGHYIGYWNFKIVIPRKDPMNFKLYGKRGNTRCMAAYNIKDYLEDTFNQAMLELFGEFGRSAEWDREQRKYVYIGVAEPDK
jgi:hypothetical protein